MKVLQVTMFPEKTINISQLREELKAAKIPVKSVGMVEEALRIVLHSAVESIDVEAVIKAHEAVPPEPGTDPYRLFSTN